MFYGNPFPPSWPQFAGYQYAARTPYRAPGAVFRRPVTTVLEGYTTTWPSAAKAMHPLVGVVGSVQINGADFFADQAGIGVTPTLSWSPPQVGSATYYRIEVLRLSNVNSGTRIDRHLADLQTRELSITILPGVLNTGETYVFRIEAVYNPSSVPPLSQSLDIAFANVLSGVMQP